MSHGSCLNMKTFKMRSTVDADEMDDFLGLNNNEQEPEETNKKSDVTDDQE